MATFSIGKVTGIPDASTQLSLAGVARCTAAHRAWLSRLLARFELTLATVGGPIPGSHWGAPEAGLIGHRVFAREDTPVHSVLHETSHVVCMSPERRARLHTDAGGDYAEENAVCYLSIVLARESDGFGDARMLADMDRWGYSFRLGSARAWFERDAEDALAWLQAAGVLDSRQRPTWALRQSPEC